MTWILMIFLTAGEVQHIEMTEPQWRTVLREIAIGEMGNAACFGPNGEMIGPVDVGVS